MNTKRAFRLHYDGFSFIFFLSASLPKAVLSRLAGDFGNIRFKEKSICFLFKLKDKINLGILNIVVTIVK